MELLYLMVALLCFFGFSCRTDAKIAPEETIRDFIDEANDGLSISSRITGGYEAPDNIAPFACSLQLKRNHFCGCAIISSDYILTAAHCFNEDTALPTDGSKIQIVTGTNEWRDPNAARYSVRRIIVHEKFDVSDYLNDIALIQTQSPIEFNERVQPIKFTSTPVLPGALLQITGWGTLKHKGPRAEKLQVLYVRSISNEECQLRSKEYIDESHLCTLSPETQGMCDGDSGGPLTNDKNELVGLTSWSIGCGRGKPEGYAKISHLHQWIVDKMKSA